MRGAGTQIVIPAKAGIQCLGSARKSLGPSFRWDDDGGHSVHIDTVPIDTLATDQALAKISP